MAAPAAGLVEMEVRMCLGVVLICLTFVITRLPWVVDKATESAEKQFGSSTVYGKSNRAANLMCKHLLALVHNVVEEGEMLGVEFAGDEVGEVADLNQNLTKRADERAGGASRVVGAHLCLDGLKFLGLYLVFGSNRGENLVAKNIAMREQGHGNQKEATPVGVALTIACGSLNAWTPPPPLILARSLVLYSPSVCFPGSDQASGKLKSGARPE